MNDNTALWKPQPGPRSWSDVYAIGIWSGVILFYFWDIVTLQRALFYFDISEINFPYRDFLANEIRTGRFARWHPGLYCGLPIFSESQAGYFHPFKYLFYPWLSTWASLNLESVFSVWLAGAATYGWLRRHLNAIGALVGAAVFGLSGFMWAHFVHTSWLNAMSGLPFAFWAVEAGWSGGGLRPLGLGALSLACQVFAGQVQVAILTGVAISIYSLYQATNQSSRKHVFQVLASPILLLGLGGLIAAIQWVPSKELLDRSPRAGGLSYEQLCYGSWHPELLPTVFVREIYGTRARDTDWLDLTYPYHEMNTSVGVAALFLGLVGAKSYRHRWVGFWVLLAGLGLWMMLGRFTFLFDYMNQIPVLGSSRIPVRYHLWVSLSVAALAGVGADRICRTGSIGLRIPIAIWLSLFVVAVLVTGYVYSPILGMVGNWPNADQRIRFGWLRSEIVMGITRSMAVMACLTGILFIRTRIKHISIRYFLVSLIPFIVICELMLSHHRDVVTIDPAYWTKEPETATWLKRQPDLQRIFGIGGPLANAPGYASRDIDFLPARNVFAWNLAPVWGLRSSSGETPIYPRRMVEYTDRAKLGNGRFDIESVSHILSGGPQLPGLGTPEQVANSLIYKNSRVLPRARLVGRPVYVANENEAASQITKLGSSFRDRTLVEDPTRPLREQTVVDPSSQVTITRDDPELIDITTNSMTDAYLFLADTFDPGWTAKVDESPAEIRPANVAFRAVFLKAGEHKVKFHYAPAGFNMGLGLTVVGVVGVLILLIIPTPKNFQDPQTLNYISTWPKYWPFFGGILFAMIVAASGIGTAHAGGLAVHKRWAGQSHQFNWKQKSEPILIKK